MTYAELISEQELIQKIGTLHYEDYRYIFDYNKPIEILQWTNDINGEEKYRLAHNHYKIPHILLPKTILNTIYFTDNKRLYGVVIPLHKKVNIKKLGKIIGFIPKEAKRVLRLADFYPNGQYPGSLSPFITDADLEDIIGNIIISSHDDPRIKVDNSFPGKHDISLSMLYEDFVYIMEKKFKYPFIKIVRLEEIAKDAKDIESE